MADPQVLTTPRRKQAEIENAIGAYEKRAEEARRDLATRSRSATANRSRCLFVYAIALTLACRSPALFFRCRTWTRISGLSHVALGRLMPFTAHAGRNSASVLRDSSL